MWSSLYGWCKLAILSDSGMFVYEQLHPFCQSFSFCNNNEQSKSQGQRQYMNILPRQSIAKWTPLQQQMEGICMGVILVVLGNKVEWYFEQCLEQLKVIYIYFPQVINFNNNQAQAMQYSPNYSFQISYPHPYIQPPQSIYYYLIPQNYTNYSYPFQSTSSIFPSSLSNHTPCQQSPVNHHSYRQIYEETSKPNQNSNHMKKLQKSSSSTKPIIKYSKKNVESNVINQIFSYISIRSKSQTIICRLLKGNEDLVQLYYSVIKQLKRHNRKYINRLYIRSLIQMKSEHIIHPILRKIDANNLLGVDRLKRILRTVITYYLRQVCSICILRSDKIDKQTKMDHLQRRRQVQDYLTYHIKYSMDNNVAQ